MSLAKEDVRKLIDIHLRAWTTQDPDLILTVFTPSATYHERVLDEPIRGHAGIREIAILGFDGGQVAGLREYWTSERLSS